MTPAEESALIAKYRPLVRAVAWSISPEAAREFNCRKEVIH